MDILNLLIVDDEYGMRRGAERALGDVRVHLPDINGEVGFAIRTAASGSELEAKLNEGPADILILDYKLPDTTGLEILDSLAKRQIDLLTIMITAYASLDTAITATRRGAYDFLAKPFTPEELRSAVRKAARHLILQRQARRLAEEKRQVRFQFISVLAHEMKSPIAAIEGYLQMIRDRAVGQNINDYDHMIARCLVRIEGMRKMIYNLLDLTSIESGQRRRTFTGVDLGEIARQSIENVRPEAVKRGISLHLDVPDGLIMEADRTEMEILFNNLISNAVKYNRDGGNVRVFLETSGEEVRLQVEDTGIGMTTEECRRLFSDFSRIRNEKTRHILGSGLGLSTLKKIVALYGGSVSVDSQPDVGSTFKVVLRKDAQKVAQAVQIQ
ncbi:MAG TPA: hybrid sensor histidine kinase/response regulator [Acidobacteriota bacterium]|nr:hybrid sensor histidine kinase/response regulator [Acidobacteriota bacterium]